MAGDADQSQDEIEELLRQAQAAAGMTPSEPAPPTAAREAPSRSSAMSPSAAPSRASTAAVAAAPPPKRSGGSASTTADDVQFLLAQAEAALHSVDHPVDPAIHGISPFQFQDLSGSTASTEKATIELLKDVELNLKIELGRTQMNLEEVLKLRRGAVVTLDKLAGDPVDIYVNGRLIARGEVLVLNDNFCVRVAELLAGAEAA